MGGIKEGTAINLQNRIVFRFTERGKDVFNLCFGVILLENKTDFGVNEVKNK